MLAAKRTSLILLFAAAVTACGDAPTVTSQGGQHEVNTVSDASAFTWSADMREIPVGSPARIEFSGHSGLSRRSFAFPLARFAFDGEAARDATIRWLAQVKPAVDAGSADPTTVRVARTVERLLAVRTPDELRTVLVPIRTRIDDTRSVRVVGPNLIEHTASFGLDGRALLRVVTYAARTPVPAFYCDDDASNVAVDPSCQSPGAAADPTFDPAQVAADLAAMQADMDALNAEFSALEHEARSQPSGECEAERAAYVSLSLAFLWTSSEAAFYGWRRDIPNTYRFVKLAIAAYGAAYTAYLKYRECLRNRGRPRL